MSASTGAMASHDESEIQRALVAGQCRFMYRFRQCRVGMADAGEVFRSTTEFHRDDSFGNDFRGIGANDMDAEDAVGSPILNFESVRYSPAYRQLTRLISPVEMIVEFTKTTAAS